MKAEEGRLSPDQPNLQENKGKQVFKVSHSEGESPAEEEIEDYQTYNPLYDFKLIKGRFFAIQSVPVRKMVQEVNKKTGDSEIKWITTWRTLYSDELGNIQRMEHDRINGETLKPEFSAEVFLNNSKLLLHKNRAKNPTNTPIEKVFTLVRNVVSQILTLPEDQLSLLSCWIIASHFNRVFAQFPPVIFGKAGSDAGGTTALMTCGLIPYPVSIFDPTEATLFRLAQYGFSLLIDEIDPDEKDRGKIKVLNLVLDGSFNKSATIPRATGKDFSVESFHPYGPKVCVDPYMAMTRPSTLSRSIRIWIKRDPKKSINMEQTEYISKNRSLIDILYSLYLTNAHKVRKAYDSVTDFTGRERQAYAPVIAIANLVGCHDQVIKALKPSIENLAMARENDPIKFVLFALYEYLKENRDDIGDDFGPGIFKQSRDKQSFSVEFGDLRKELSNFVAEVHQIDVVDTSESSGSGTSTRKREWKKVPGEFRQFFEASKFNSIIKNALPDFSGMVRGNKWGLRFDAVDEKEKDKADGKREVDPILDELEKTLRIGEEQSYKYKEEDKEKEQNPRDKTSQYESEEGPVTTEYNSSTSEEYDDQDNDDLDNILD
jgi:hypothetical protein